MALAVLVALAGIAFLVALVFHSSAAVPSPAKRPGAAPAPLARGGNGPKSAPAPSSAPSATPAPVAGAPRLSGLTPTSGRPGEILVVHGVRLFSVNGIVVARVGGEETRTVCPTRSTCDVTVPRLGKAGRTVEVTITTARGISNSVPFSYR